MKPFLIAFALVISGAQASDPLFELLQAKMGGLASILEPDPSSRTKWSTSKGTFHHNLTVGKDSCTFDLAFILNGTELPPSPEELTASFSSEQDSNDLLLKFSIKKAKDAYFKIVKSESLFRYKLELDTKNKAESFLQISAHKNIFPNENFKLKAYHNNLKTEGNAIPSELSGLPFAALILDAFSSKVTYTQVEITKVEGKSHITMDDPIELKVPEGFTVEDRQKLLLSVFSSFGNNAVKQLEAQIAGLKDDEGAVLLKSTLGTFTPHQLFFLQKAKKTVDTVMQSMTALHPLLQAEEKTSTSNGKTSEADPDDSNLDEVE